MIKNLFPLSEISPPKTWQVHIFAAMGVLLSFLRGVRHESMISLAVTVLFGLLWLFRRDLLARLLFFLVRSLMVLIQSLALVLLTVTFFTVFLALHVGLILKKKDPLQKKWTSDQSYLEAPEKLADDLFLRPF